MIYKILNTGLTQDLDYFQRTSIRIVNGVALCSLFTTAIAEGYILWSIGIVPSGLTIAMATIIFALSYLFLNKYHFYDTSKKLLAFNANLTLIVVFLLVHPDLRADDMFLVLIPLYIGIFKELKTILTLSMITLSIYMVGIYFSTFVEHDYLMTFSDENKVIVRMTFLSLTLTLLYTTTLFFKRGTEKSRLEIEAKNEALTQLLAANKIQLSELKKGIEEKQFLLSEVHHKVNNNLQVLSSILQLQEGEQQEPKAILSQFSNRINSLSLIHRQIYQEENFESIAITPLIQGIILQHYNSQESSKISFELKPSNFQLNIAKASSFVLFMNEVFLYVSEQVNTQALDFINPVLMECKHKHDLLYIHLNFSPDFWRSEKIQNNTINEQLMKLLAKQLKADLTLDTNKGIHLQIALPL
ncbi:Histidine kinase [Lishizhenia tianjinensis]|uniref:histidine kinase n=1 Tax=Lishizhenia tianjinensis TaxID=477690 RepID=A0A1I7B4K4_9FLAO|nr:histidine kinase dimerization/phosphoacceptor domain -containing protein [Lishizhenia tianjinensis]SFT82109.1 Histidine kinase [Lishizhenia tianjinensis]